MGLLGLVAVLLEWNSNLSADRMRTALTALPQSNLATSARGTSNGGGRKCCICQDPGHYANRCPQKNNNGNMSSDQTVKSGYLSPSSLEEWKYCQPADLTKVSSRFMGKSGSFVQNVNVVSTEKIGILQLSHWATDQMDGYGQQNPIIQ